VTRFSYGNFDSMGHGEPPPESVTTSEIRCELQFCNAQQMGKKRDLGMPCRRRVSDAGMLRTGRFEQPAVSKSKALPPRGRN
jgi:hypothetical protein